MTRIRGRVAVVGLLMVAFAAGGLLAVRNVSAVPPPTAVKVINGAGEAVPTSITGTPTVNVDGAVTVQSTRQPFQQFVAGVSQAGENCDPITVPAGKRLVVESFSVDADSTTADPPSVYLRVDVHSGNATVFVRPVPVELTRLAVGWSGVANVLLHSGSPAPGGEYTLSTCVFHADGADNGSYRGIVSGWLEDARTREGEAGPGTAPGPASVGRTRSQAASRSLRTQSVTVGRGTPSSDAALACDLPSSSRGWHLYPSARKVQRRDHSDERQARTGTVDVARCLSASYARQPQGDPAAGNWPRREARSRRRRPFPISLSGRSTPARIRRHR